MYIGYGYVIHCMGNICACVIRISELIRSYIPDYSFIFITNVKSPEATNVRGNLSNQS